MSGTQPPRRARRLLPAVAALLAGLVLATAWVVRLSTALVERSEATQRAVTGTDAELALVDDDGDLPLFDGVVLDPGDTVRSCVALEARTVGDPEPLRLHLDGPVADAALAEHVRIDLAAGELVDEQVRQCVRLEPTSASTGRLPDLLRRLAPDGPGWTAVDPPPGVTSWWYRLEVTLDEELPDELQGASIDGLALRWSTESGELAAQPVRERAVVFVTGVAENAVLPVVLLVAGSLLFLAIHQRIDGDDPKLALAPVDRRMVQFRRREVDDLDLLLGDHDP